MHQTASRQRAHRTCQNVHTPLVGNQTLAAISESVGSRTRSESNPKVIPMSAMKLQAGGIELSSERQASGLHANHDL